MFNIFKRTSSFDDTAKQALVDALVEMLDAQRSIAPNSPIEVGGHIKRKALGYIYGFIDAALTTLGQDMSDVSVGVPITFQVLRHLFPGREDEYLTFLRRNIAHDGVLLAGMMHGGQQYLDYMRPEMAGSAPMGFARFLIDGDDP